MSDYLSKDDDSEIEMRETEHGVAISLRMIEDGEETAGTTFYLRPEQVRGMADWLSKHSRGEATREGWIQVNKDDQRFHRGAYVGGGAPYAVTVRSNGDGYDHFVIALPELPARATSTQEGK